MAVVSGWTPSLTRGLWSALQRYTNEGGTFAGARDQAAVYRSGEIAAGRADPGMPDAATLSHIYSRAVGQSAVARAEAAYRGAVDPATYLARRPSGRLVAPNPIGWGQAGNYYHVVTVTGTDPITGALKRQPISVVWPRLLSRGEAIDLAKAAVAGGSPPGITGPLEGEYMTTWRSG